MFEMHSDVLVGAMTKINQCICTGIISIIQDLINGLQRCYVRLFMAIHRSEQVDVDVYFMRNV